MCSLALAANANIIPFAICSTVIVVFLIVIDYMLMHTFEQLHPLHQLELDKQQTELLLKSEAENYARLQEQAQILIVVIGQALVMLIDCTAKNTVGKGVALCLNLPASVDKFMAVLCRVNGI